MNEKELRQLQTALKGVEGVTLARKAPRQMGLCVDFRGHGYRVDFVAGEGWQVTRTKDLLADPPDLAELQALVPVLLKCQQDKEAEAITKVEAKKAEEEKAKADAIASEKARKAKLEELREACHRAYIPGFNSQDWAKEKFGRWNFNELALEELEILWAEMKQRAKAWEENPSGKYPPNLLRLSWEEVEQGEAIVKVETPCPNCEGTGDCAGVRDGCECMGDCPSDGLCPECLGKGAIAENSCMDEDFEGEFYQFDPSGAIHKGQDLESFLSQTSLQDFFPGCVVDIAEDSPTECMEGDSSIEEKAIALKGKALTLKQPWAWAVFNCGKNIENRSWDTSYRGRLFIHAGQAYDHSGAAWIAEKFGVEVPGPGNLPEGAIVGWVEIGSVSQESLKPNLFPWAIEGQYHWHLKRPYQFHKPIPYQGRLGLWPVEIPFPTPPQWILDNAQEFWARNTQIPNGSPYCPSNGSEGDWFCGGWCEQCSKLNSCPLPIRSMAGDQPAEWVYWDQKPICLAWDEAIADKPLAYYPYQGNYKVGDAEGNLEEFESAEEAIEFINQFPRPGKSLASYQLAEEVLQ